MVVLIKNNINEDLKQCINKKGRNDCKNTTTMENLNNIQNTNAYLYIRTLSGTDDGYRLIVEYQDTYTDYSKSRNKQKDGTCPNHYILENNKCYRQVTKSYFNNVKLYAEV